MSSQSTKTGSGRRAPTSVSDTASGSGPIQIEIRGQKLTIRSDREATFVRSLARYIDHKAEELQAAAPSAPFDKLMMLASMTVAEELFEARDELHRMHTQLSETTETLLDLINQVEEA
ncbi:cell division protein ZapA [Lujinxingia litoralis]|uniref:cell division protein ZapA n=1 Tax=Lujinxingia litoralis TaxID=2211119 RepID=UPI001313E46E|nr:cell division protein ZapA [Lujinxingia litoralis]